MMQYNDWLGDYPRKVRNQLLNREKRLRKTGRWGVWRKEDDKLAARNLPGWGGQVTHAMVNDVFSVLVRPLPDGAVHLGISSLSGIRPTWHEMQRIKDEIAGPEKTAVEIYPPRNEIMDGANMFHVFVLPGDSPYTIKNHEEDRK